MTGNLLVFLGAALASAAEMVETLTIVLALGIPASLWVSLVRAQRRTPGLGRRRS